MKKEYTIIQLIDDKGDKAIFKKDMEIDEEEIPTKEELEKIIELVDKNKSVAFFIGENEITWFSYKNRRKFAKKVISEYITSFDTGVYKGLYLATDEKIASIIREEIDAIKEKNVKVIGYMINNEQNNEEGLKEKRMLRK